MKAETQSIRYSIRINPSLKKAIYDQAKNDQVKPSKLIRQMITDKLHDFGTLKTTE